MPFQMLLSHPMFSGNPQLQQQVREQIPMFLQQVTTTHHSPSPSHAVGWKGFFFPHE